MICFHEPRDRCDGQFDDWHREADLYHYGRCRSGRRWFWAAVEVNFAVDDYQPEHGWEDTEDEARAAARVAVERLAGGRPGVAFFSAGFATDELKRVNAERRRNRPDPGTSDAKPVEYLYGHNTWDCDTEGRIDRCPCHDLPRREAWQFHLVPFRVTKKTVKRIYYVRREPHRVGQVFSTDELAIGFVDRRKLEADGEVRNRGVHWSQVDSHLYATTDPPEWWQRWRPAESMVDVSRLRVEMADAHPDRGGTAEGFMVARRRYLQAKGLVR